MSWGVWSRRARKRRPRRKDAIEVDPGLRSVVSHGVGFVGLTAFMMIAAMCL